MKSLSSLYLDAYEALANKQHAKYGNPTAAQMPAPSHVPLVLTKAVANGFLTNEQARKLAVALGRKAYGEVGLTPGTVSGVMDKVLGFNALGYTIAAPLESALCGY